MKNVLYLNLIIILNIVSCSLSSQQEPMFTQYMDNQIFVNPAFTGAKDYLEITGVYREQWVGINGAPNSTTFSFQTPLKNKSLAIGADFLNDKIDL